MISATPLNMSFSQLAPDTSCRPCTPVARTKIASSVPQTLNRPGISCVEPRKAAANAGSRRVPPKFSDGPFSEANMIPAPPAMVAESTSATVV